MDMGPTENLSEDKENLTDVLSESMSDEGLCILDDEWWERKAPWIHWAKQTAKAVAKASAAVKTPLPVAASPHDVVSLNVPSLPTDLVLNVLETLGLPMLRPAGTLNREWNQTTRSYSARWKGLLEPLPTRFGTGLLESPDTMTLLSDGTIAVSDFGASCVEIFSITDGKHVRTIGIRGAVPPSVEREAELAELAELSEAGLIGDDDAGPPSLPVGQFDGVKGLASDDGYLYIGDYFGGRVQRTETRNGTFSACEHRFGCPHGLAVGEHQGTKLLFVSERGDEPRDPKAPIDWRWCDKMPSSHGQISVVDARTMRFRKVGVKALAHKGGDARLMCPLGMAARNDELFVTDLGHSCVHVYSISKMLVDAKPPTGDTDSNGDAAVGAEAKPPAGAIDPYVRRIGGPGDTPGLFRQPVGVAVTRGDLLVVSGEWRVQVLTLAGAPLRMLHFGRLVGGLCVAPDRVYVGLPWTQFHKEEPKPPEVGVIKMSGRWLA